MVKMYDFGADYRGISANERRAFAWPIAVWSCYIPESDTQDLNILEHLILQLINNEFTDPKAILCGQVGFNKDLVEAALDACRDKGYFDRRYKKLTLSNDGKSMLDAFDNPYAADLITSRKSKKIYMIQDLVTKSVIPVFDINKLPQFYYEDENAIVVNYDNYFGKKPRSASIKTALRYWARLCYNRRNGVLSESNTIEVSEAPEELGEVEDFIPFEDEVDWENILEDGTVQKEELRTLSDKENETLEIKAAESVNNITIMDDLPEQYWARGFIAINKIAPDEVLIISPFGERLNDWFRTVINRLRTCNSDFEDELQLFLIEKKDELRNIIAFGNDLDIALFNEYPYVCNNQEFKAVKTLIERLTESKNRFLNGEDDSITFAQTLGTAYEASIRLVVKKNPYLLERKVSDKKEYQNELKMLVSSHSFLDDVVYEEYCSGSIYNNMRYASADNGSTTGYMGLILIDAWKNRTGKSMELIRNNPEFILRIKEITSNLNTRKEKGIRNIASHGGDEIADLKLSMAAVISQYEEFEKYFRVLYNLFMEGIVDGESK